jgi:TolB-like protein/DNA-binding winged helix-turn-helix (wHTH) protein/Tfp pilus assembly protein PilF
MNEDVRYLVGDLVIYPGRGRVLRGEKEILLPKLSFDLLLVLVRAAPNLLSIDALTDKVWPGLVVTPETVSQRVKLLRDALGDDPKAPRYIAGLRGRGYQIIAPVHEAPVERRQARLEEGSSPAHIANPAEIVQPASPPPVSAASPASKRRRMIKAVGGTTLLAAVLTLGAYLFESKYDSKDTLGERALVVNSDRPADDEKAAAFSPPPRSVAVLSFANLSGDPSEEYFSDGLSEELVHALTRIAQLRVAARTSSFSFKGSSVDIPTMGRKLNVGAVLEGSVRKSGSRVRITAQLINAVNGYHLWSQVYDREVKDVLALQSEIARSVADTLQVTLAIDAQEKLAVGGTRNALAFDAYLRGRHGESIQDEPGLRAALAALDEAIALDPQYADAHAFRGEVLAQLATIWAQEPQERERLQRDARSSAEKAVAMAPRSGLAHGVLASVLSATTAEYGRIDAEYRRSIELEPGNAELLLGYASYGALFGRADALAAAKRALGLDPLSASAHANLGVVLFYARRHDEARIAFLEATKLGVNRLTINWTGVNELAAGDASAALPYCERDRAFWYDQWCLAITYHKLDRKKEAAAMLERLKKAQGDGAAYQYAEIHAQWGAPREALAWLAKAVELNDAGLLAIKVDPFLDPIRNTPQFKEIVRKLELPS